MPVFTVEGNTNVCKGEYTTLVANGNAQTYYWGYQTPIYDKNISNNGMPIAVQIETPTYVFAKGVDNNGCESEISLPINLLTPPIVKYEGNTTVCLGESIELQASGNAKKYFWSTDGGVTKKEGNPFTFTPEGVTRIILSGEADNGCVTSNEIYIETNVAPNVDIYGDSVICEGEIATLVADGAAHFVWQDAATNKVEEGRSITRSGLKPGANKFYITGTTINDCKNTKEFTLLVHANPTVKIHDTITGCPMTETTAELTVKDPNILWCEWSSFPIHGDIISNSSKKVIATITEPTEVYVTAIDGNGCKAYDTLMVDALKFNPIKFDVTPTIIDSKNNTIEMTGIFPETHNWTWDTDDNTDDKRGQSVKYAFTNPSTRDSFLITARAIDEKGCLYEGDTIVYVWKDFWAPNAFTPNDDDINDGFHFLGTEFMTDFHFIIYDRTGRIVFEGNDRNAKWDGRDLNGNLCPWGVYGYVVDFKSEYKGIDKQDTRKGTITLIR